MPRRLEPAGPLGQELIQFFTTLTDPANLTAYHADPAAYVQAQQAAGVVGAEAAQMILGEDPVIVTTLDPPGGTSLCRVVFPP
jgi:hypothetical protein